MDTQIVGYEVRNRITGAVRLYDATQRIVARRYADKCDNAYGCYICRVVPVFSAALAQPTT